MSLEVANEGGIVRREEPNRVVDLGTRIYDALRMMREAGQVYAILCTL